MKGTFIFGFVGFTVLLWVAAALLYGELWLLVILVAAAVLSLLVCALKKLAAVEQLLLKGELQEAERLRQAEAEEARRQAEEERLAQEQLEQEMLEQVVASELGITRED